MGSVTNNGLLRLISVCSNHGNISSLINEDSAPMISIMNKCVEKGRVHRGSHKYLF